MESNVIYLDDILCEYTVENDTFTGRYYNKHGLQIGHEITLEGFSMLAETLSEEQKVAFAMSMMMNHELEYLKEINSWVRETYSIF